MVASKATRLGEQVIPSQKSDGFRLLKMGIILGANASGKTNFVKAMACAQELIENGLSTGQSMPEWSFKLDPSSQEKPTIFSFEIRTELGCFEYEFAIDRSSVVYEVLKKVTRRSERVVFKRIRKDEFYDFSTSIKFKSSKDKQFFEFTEQGSPSNKLFLTECRDRNMIKNIPYIESINSVMNWFEEKLTIIFPHSKYSGLEMAMHKDGDAAGYFSEILSRYDTGIQSLELVEVEFQSWLDGLPKEAAEQINSALKKGDDFMFTIQIASNARYRVYRSDDGPVKVFKVLLNHENILGDNVPFSIAEESDGTQRLIDLIPGLRQISMGEKVFVIDELDRSLHPTVTRSIISDFLSETAGGPGQLIVTTHDSTLLDQELLRKDEYWFTRKSDQGNSEIYSLEEFDLRFDKSLQKDYLNGRFNGVPIIRHAQA